MYSKLTYRIAETEFKPEVVSSVREVYGLYIGKGYIYSVSVSFKGKDGWSNPFWMVYDTGAVVSLLPLKFSEILGIEKYAPVKLTGISPEMEIPARLTRATLKFTDLEGKETPEIESWIAIAERKNVPLIIGLKSIADKHNFIVNAREKKFYLEFY